MLGEKMKYRITRRGRGRGKSYRLTRTVGDEIELDEIISQFLADSEDRSITVRKVDKTK